MAIINQTDALLAATQPSAVARTGDVTAITATTLIVNVGGTQINASYLRGTDFLIGDLVVVLKQDSSWLCLGALSGFGPNSLINPSFELQGLLSPAAAITGWTTVNVAGTSDVAVVASQFAPSGTLVAQVSPSASGADKQFVLASDAIEVVAGDVWSVSAYFAGQNLTATPTVDVSLRVYFSAAPGAYVPGSDTLIVAATNINDPFPFTLLSGTVTVPASQTLMRVGLRAVLQLSGGNVPGVQFDFAVARKVG